MILYLCAQIKDTEDRRKLISLYTKNHIKMEQVALSILHNCDDAEDAVQNAFLQVIKHFEKIKEIPCQELPFWCISIVKNEARMILRKRRPLLPLDDWDGFVSTVESITNYSTLVALFQRLPDSYQAVLEMQLLLGYSQREIAQHLCISETAVASRSSRGRKLLRDIVTKEGFLL